MFVVAERSWYEHIAPQDSPVLPKVCFPHHRGATGGNITQTARTTGRGNSQHNEIYALQLGRALQFDNNCTAGQPAARSRFCCSSASSSSSCTYLCAHQWKPPRRHTVDDANDLAWIPCCAANTPKTTRRAHSATLSLAEDHDRSRQRTWHQ